jgi:hypothetical protein
MSFQVGDLVDIKSIGMGFSHNREYYGGNLRLRLPEGTTGRISIVGGEDRYTVEVISDPGSILRSTAWVYSESDLAPVEDSKLNMAFRELFI